MLYDATLITADAGYHSEANLGKLAKQQIDAYIPDNGYRQRDERYADQGKHKVKPDPLWDKSAKPKKAALYKPSDFQHDLSTRTCICPAGKKLYGNGAECIINGYKVTKYQGAVQDCGPCDRRHLGLRNYKRLDRFTLRGQKKVDSQWKLYCLVHNIEKLAHHGYAA